MSAGLLAPTSTPGIAAPDESRTDPAIAAWANAADGMAAIHPRTRSVITPDTRSVRASTNILSTKSPRERFVPPTGNLPAITAGCDPGIETPPTVVLDYPLSPYLVRTSSIGFGTY